MRSRPTALGVAIALLAVTVAACGGTSGASTTSKGPIQTGELLPMTGKEAFVGQWFDHGTRAGLWDVNHNGGVLGGRQLTTTLADTAGDPVDAVTAFRQLMTHNPVVIFGPSSLEIEGVIRDFGASKVVDLMQGGTTQLDHMQYPYVFRVFPSDSAMLSAEAYYALHTGCTRAALMYTADANAQAEVPPILKAFTGHGGTIVDNEQIVAGQSSYLSEVAKAFANNPQCVFFHADPQTASTLFANVRQLGHLNVRFITGDTGASIQLAKAMGLSSASKYMTGMAAPIAYQPAWNEFLKSYQAVWHTNNPLPAAPAMYDAVVMAALAMDAAHSTVASVWVKKITTISNPPGTSCYTYASCLALLNKGQKINYQGASGPENFNQFHNVFSAFNIVQFDTSGNLKPVFGVTSKNIASMY